MSVATMADKTGKSWDVVFGSSRVVFGRNSIESLGGLVESLGVTRAVLVSDPMLVSAGHVDRAALSMRNASIEVVIFDGVDENPTTDNVRAGTEVARDMGANGIVGLGGGSPMDCAKGINFLLSNGGEMVDYWGKGKAAKPMLPTVGVPTTAGTGSEAQSYALISQAETGTKMACGDDKAKFQTVVLDPTLAATAPRAVVAATGIDAISHAIESYVSTRSNPLSMMFAREAWRLLSGNFMQVLSGPDDLDAVGRMLLGSYLAGASIEHSMLGAAHACANPLTARYDVIHGHAVALMLPHVMQFNIGAVSGAYDVLLGASRESDRPATLTELVCQLRAAAGLPERLRDCAVPDNSLSELAREASEQWTAAFNPAPVTRGDLLRIYEAAW